MSSWMRSVWLYCRMARPTRKIISNPCTHQTTVCRVGATAAAASAPTRSVSYLVHENVKDARGDGQREEGEEEGEEPRRGVHGRVETLRSEMDVQLRQLLLREAEFGWSTGREEKRICCPPVDKVGGSHLQQVLKLVDAESQLGHAGLEEFPQAVLLHQAHKHAEGLFLGHLGAEQRPLPGFSGPH